jgi:hypothetical protein
MKHIYEVKGSLITDNAYITSPCDLAPPYLNRGNYRPLSKYPKIRNAAVAPFQLPYHELAVVHIINAFGIALGDSIIGINALAYLKQLYPGLQFIIYRPCTAPKYVDELYHEIAGKLAVIRYLPWELNRIPQDEVCIDIGNYFFWPAFHLMNMMDFFLWALGFDYTQVPTYYKSNNWINKLHLPQLLSPWESQPYILFCSNASTPLRTIPYKFHADFIDLLWTEYKLPVLGYTEIKHPHYINITQHSLGTLSYIAWVKSAKLLLGVDSSAIHIASGFGVTTLAFFATVDPALRVRDYPFCTPIPLNILLTDTLDVNPDPQDLKLLELAYANLLDQFKNNQIRFPSCEALEYKSLPV